MDMSGCLWLRIVISCYSWLSMVINYWISMVVYG